MFAESSYFYGTGTGTHRHRGMAVKAKRAAEMHAQQRQGAHTQKTRSSFRGTVSWLASTDGYSYTRNRV
jgi:hypothetical protein